MLYEIFFDVRPFTCPYEKIYPGCPKIPILFWKKIKNAIKYCDIKNESPPLKPETISTD